MNNIKNSFESVKRTIEKLTHPTKKTSLSHQRTQHNNTISGQDGYERMLQRSPFLKKLNQTTTSFVD